MLERLLRAPRGYYGVIAIAVLLAAPTTHVSFFLDDYAHLLAIDGRSTIASPWNVYCFAPGDPAAMKPLVETGPLPWFTSLDLKVRFLRPLSSATMRLDRLLFGKAVWAYHVHSILWYLVLLIVLALILNSVIPGMLGVLVLLLFAVDETHWFPTMWWSHRNSMVAAAFGFAGLLAYVRWRRDGWKPGLPLSIAGCALGLLGGEVALAVFGYLFAYEIAGQSGPLRKRMTMILYAMTLAVVYVAAYSYFGYGVHGTGCYFSPVAEPIDFLSHAPLRFLNLAANQFTTLPAGIPAVIPAVAVYFAGVGVIALVGVAFALRAAWRYLNEDERAGVRWLALGGLLSVAPFLAPFSSGRLLLVPSLGGAAVIGAIIVGFWRWRAVRGRNLRSVTIAGWAFIGLHLVVAAIIWIVAPFGFQFFNSRAEQGALTAEIGQAVTDQEIMLLNVPDPLISFYGCAIREQSGLPRPAAWRPLTMAPFDHVFTRTGPNSFDLSVVNGEMFTTLQEEISRNPKSILAAGTELDFDAFDVRVVETGKTGPTKVAFTFPANLDDPRYLWLTWQDGRLRPMRVPQIGQSVNLPVSRL
jgi:hypothetical protein